MKVYIAGKITGTIDYEMRFAEAEAKLKAEGHTVLNPVKNKGFTYKEYIDMGLCELMRCDAIYLLDGWQQSEGSRLEAYYAVTVGIKIFFESSGVI